MSQLAKIRNFLPNRISYLKSIYSFFWFWLKTAAAFCLLALSLWCVKECCPKIYKFLTYWANQEAAPNIEKCILYKLPTPDIDIEKNLIYYEADIYTNIINKLGAVLIFPKIEYLDILNSEKKPYTFLWKIKINGKLEDKIKIVANNKYIDFEGQSEFDGYECPLRVEIVLDEKD